MYIYIYIYLYIFTQSTLLGSALLPSSIDSYKITDEFAGTHMFRCARSINTLMIRIYAYIFLIHTHIYVYIG